jgi:hypothetical protein
MFQHVLKGRGTDRPCDGQRLLTAVQPGRLQPGEQPPRVIKMAVGQQNRRHTTACEALGFPVRS